jgi:UDPglucose 6-dehydrogenase
MNISIIGTGYVGLVTGICLSSLGMNVLCCDIDKEKIEKLKRGILPIFEPNLDSLLDNCAKHGRLSFTTDIKETADFSDILFITVNTPTMKDNTCDLRNVFSVVSVIAGCMTSRKIIVNKSTVPPGTGQKIKEEVRRILEAQQKTLEFDIVSNPEFLREGSAVQDFINTKRIVIGAESEYAISMIKEVYRDQIQCNTPVLVTDIVTAEMIKYASNSFLAAKISFINEIAGICELCGADVMEVARGMGMDSRIGPDFLNPGPGFGGSCFPKDVRALEGLAESHGYIPVILNSILEFNNHQAEKMAIKISDTINGLEGHKIAVLGLSFKPGTDDIRESPAISIIKILLNNKAIISVYDPKAMENMKQEYPDLPLRYCMDAYSACTQSDCIVLATDWTEFSCLDFKKLKMIVRKPVFIDLRNVYKPSCVRDLGFIYEGFGRK